MARTSIAVHPVVTEAGLCREWRINYTAAPYNVIYGRARERGCTRERGERYQFARD